MKKEKGGVLVKLVGLLIEGLYGCYNYNVKFNTDVTFLYGMNGCGKTTVLNITEAIITGQLFKLFDYEFKRIKLNYAKSTAIKDIKTICISSKKSAMAVEFNGESYTLEVPDTSENFHSSERSNREVYRSYFNKYHFLTEIKKLFNYVYLPLNRSTASYDEEDDYFLIRRYRARSHFDSEVHFGSITRDPAMVQIELLINYNHSKISSTITQINDEFRNDILKSLLESNITYNFADIAQEISKTQNTASTLKRTQKAYLRMLTELDLLSEEEVKRYNKFFSDFIDQFIAFQKGGFRQAPLDFILKFQEMSKIKQLLDIAEQMEKRKADARKPIETFLDTMNEFVSNSEDGKIIDIDSVGQVYFKTKYSDKPISIQQLSSGEKQLITFFANLIFNVKSNSSGIFVVDEPELSLHLSWQKIFVEKTMKINKNIQLIFATHAPEIIGKRRDKMFKLEKQYNGVPNNG